ncbi:spore coat polysaccharide biosynthesis protein SpsF [Hydrogenophaga palleronii]|uniref:Spore coat polysaccharide biosynthesis protein SpsF n=1 Tax=Hydrogenophaga palleronii TaxID=65655 RepID=A0ABU1WTB9_9BURK|nr:pseudaminic acid biosynthesis-associated methylase [Hydrogenophaga palleronii]MDR7152334.1 spore coat polysaccharide biosynthesis protein SpsF [Hydrogenophaga palleronii]
MSFKTEQETFWAGDFGSDYVKRNQGNALKAANIDFFSKALRATRGLRSCMEFGANIGMNLMAIKLLYPSIKLHGIEINAEAASLLSEVVPPAQIHLGSVLDFEPVQTYDLVLIKTVLIHINPGELAQVYDKLVKSCGRYLLVAEYYNPTPMSISYRGHTDRLFKRDFAGELMDRHPGMSLVDYGFAYHRDPNFPQDDINWFLMEKR